NKRFSWTLSFSYLFLTILAIFSAFPLFWIVLNAVKGPGESSKNPTSFIPKNFTLDNYKVAFSELGFGTNLMNSLFIALAATFIAILFASMAAYAIVRFFPNFGKKMSRFLLMTYMFPPI